MSEPDYYFYWQVANSELEKLREENKRLKEKVEELEIKVRDLEDWNSELVERLD